MKRHILLTAVLLTAYFCQQSQAQVAVIKYKEDTGKDLRIKDMSAVDKFYLSDADDVIFIDPTNLFNIYYDEGNAFTNTNTTSTQVVDIIDGGELAERYGINQLLLISPTSSNKNVEITFNVFGIVEGTYYVYALIAPADKYTDIETPLPSQFRMSLYERDANEIFPSETKPTNIFLKGDSKNFQNDITKGLEPIYVGNYSFISEPWMSPHSLLKIESYVLASQTTNYTRDIAFAGFLLVKDSNSLSPFYLKFDENNIKAFDIIPTNKIEYISLYNDAIVEPVTVSDKINDYSLKVESNYGEAGGNVTVKAGNNSIVLNDANENHMLQMPVLMLPGCSYSAVASNQDGMSGESILTVTDNGADIIELGDANVGPMVTVPLKIKGLKTFWENCIKNNPNALNQETHYAFGVVITDEDGNEETTIPSYHAGLPLPNPTANECYYPDIIESLTIPSEYKFEYGKKYKYRAFIIPFYDNKIYPIGEEKEFTYLTKKEFDRMVAEQSLPTLMAGDANISIFSEALQKTGLADSLMRYRDDRYIVGKDSIYWTANWLVCSVMVEYDNVAYPENHYFKYTAFAETNEVFEKYGVTDFEGLVQLAKQIYDTKYPADAGITDLTDRRNSLNRFISYHLLPFQGTYYSLTCGGQLNSTLAMNFDRKNIDISDWYETMMPYSTMKFSFPSGRESGLYINRRGVQSRPDQRGYKYRGAKVLPPSEADVNQMAINGVYHYIDDIISYGVQLDGTDIQDYVFSDRMRIDATTLSPDFMTSGARGHYTKSSIENGKYATSDMKRTADNTRTCLGFKPGSVKNFEFTDYTHLHVRPRTLSFWSYQGDDVAIKGRYDITVKLPPIPEGDWELRLGTCIGFSSNGMVDYYINGKYIKTVDLRPGGTDPAIGWISDDDLGDDNLIALNDQSMRNLGWMKGPASYWAASSEAGGSQGTIFRNADMALRNIIGTIHSDGKHDNYLRICQIKESMSNELMLDYIELVPKNIYDNPDILEDKW